MDDPHQPLILCMDDVNGEEVALRIEQTDDFQTFLDKAKTMLGFEVDINSITRNQQVSLNDNIYQFLVNAEQNLAPEPMPIQTYDQILEPNGSNDYYILDDGTQIRASQIHFDNEDPHVDLSAEKIPFVKYVDDGIEGANDFDLENIADVETTKYNIVGSPISHWSSEESSPKRSFVNTLPFKLVCNNTSAFEAQFTKYLENSTAKTYTTLNPVINRNKSPRSLIRDNYKNYDDKFSKGDDFSEYTREEILNMFKDSPVTSLPYEGQNLNEKRKHVRKTDPSRAVHKNWNSKPVNYEDGILIGDVENQNCFICGKFVENNMEKLYLFDNEDQKLHRSSPQKKSSRQLKIICENCLGKNFKPGRMKGPNQCLNSDEYLVIRNNQQYIFQKTNKIEFKTDFVDSETDLTKKKETSKRKEEKEKVEFVKVEIGSDGEIVTKPIDNDPRSPDDVVIVKDEDKDLSSDSDVEIIEPPEIDDSVIDNLDDADEDVKEFLGKYQQDGNTVTELKCRFCERVFADLSEVVDHGDEHKHELEEDAVYPCPLCDYGYANSKWLKGHIKAAHEKPGLKVEKENNEVNNNNEDEPKSKTGSPIAKRTRSSSKKVGNDTDKESPEKPAEENAQIVTNAESTESTLILKTEVKQEAIDSSDDEIWIVQTGDDDATEQIENLLQAAKGCQKENVSGPKKSHKCFCCSRIFPTEETLSSHKCRSRKGRKRKSVSKDDNVVCMPSKEDFLKRAQRRPRTSNLADSDNELLVPRGRRKKNKEPTSDPQIVTCHNCNESFTSKVRLKFHMQFHSPSRQPPSDGRYACRSCAHARFDTETELFDHVHFQHDKQKRWQCPVARCGKTFYLRCYARFDTETELFDHVHFQHDKQKRWQCPVVRCGKTFYLRATLTKHSRTHTDTRRYVCVTCGKRFLDKQTLDEHGVTHLQIKPFQCHICLKQLTRRSRLRMHLRAHEEELTLARVLVCAVCSRAFSGPTDAQDHAAKSTECIEEFAKELKEETEETPPQLSPTSGLVREIAPKTESPKLKKQIPRQVSDSLAEPLLSSLGDEARGIIRVVEIEKAFRCEFCEDVFYLEDGLNSHRTIHKDVKNPFTCHICKVAFATYSRCTTHKTTHGFYKRPLADAKKNASKPSEPEAGPSATGILGYGGFPVVKHFLCEDCGRSYLHWTYLQVHRRMKHPNDNFLYKCNHCDITFPNSWSLAYHRKKIHGQAGQGDTNATSKIPREDYRIPCRDCDEILPNKTALYKHRKKEHSDISLRVNSKPTSSYSPSNPTTRPNPTASVASCARCGEGFETIDDLHKHSDIQCRRRTHTCPVCAHTFRSASVRDEHLRTHTGERPFPCDVCGLAFRRSAAMRHHRLTHSARAWACARCPRRFRTRADLRHHARAKHPATQAVIEIQGLNPSLDEIMQHLLSNNISPDKVIEITKMSFAKGTVSVAPTCARALAMLGDVPRTKVAWNIPTFIDFQQPPSGIGAAKILQTPSIPQKDAEDPPQETPYPITINVTGGELTDMDVQMLLRDGVLVNGNQMVQLQLNDSMLE